MRVNDNTNGGNHCGQNSSDRAHMIDVDAACFGETRVGTRSCHCNPDFGAGEKPHQQAAQAEKQQPACRYFNSENAEGQQSVQKMSKTAQKAMRYTKTMTAQKPDDFRIVKRKHHPANAH